MSIIGVLIGLTILGLVIHMIIKSQSQKRDMEDRKPRPHRPEYYQLLQDIRTVLSGIQSKEDEDKYLLSIEKEIAKFRGNPDFDRQFKQLVEQYGEKN